MSGLEMPELLWQAFLAGFEASGEGFNGEYVGRRFEGWRNPGNPVFDAEMRPKFERWFSEATR